MIKSVWNAFTSGISNPAQWLIEFLGGKESTSGIKVNSHTAIGYPPVWYAVSKIAGHVGQLPLTVRRRIERGAVPATAHPAYRLTKVRPNEFQTAITFKETLMAHALLQGNGRAFIDRDRRGLPIGLYPMMPERSATAWVDGEKWHVTSVDQHEPLAGRKESDGGPLYYKIPDRDVFHVPGLGFNGIEGLSLITVARETFGLGLGGQKATARNFKNNARPSILLESPQSMFRDEEEAKQFIDNFNEAHAGIDAAGKAGLLRDGMKAHLMPVSAKDAEWLEQRKFERQDTALLFMLEQILGDDSSVSYKSLEQKMLAYLTNCLMRWLVKWEQEADEKLLSEREKKADSHFFKFNEKALLRADSKTQMETIKGYISARVYNPNEGRELLDRNPYPGGDEYLNPNITPGGETESGGGSTDDDDDAENQAARAAVLSRLHHLIGVESKRAIDAASSHRIYTDWLDKFYGGWQRTLAAAIEDLGGDPSIAESYCAESQEALLALAGTVTDQSAWPAAVEGLVQSWPGRAEALADQILNQELSHVEA